MTYGPSLAAPGAAPQPRPTAHDAPRRVRGLRRFGAAALAAGTFVGLGALIGPVGVASAEPAGCNLSNTDWQTYDDFNTVAETGVVSLCENLSIDQTVTINSPTIIDLNGHTLTFEGNEEAPGTPGLEIKAKVTVQGGSLSATGATGPSGYVESVYSPSGGPGGDGVIIDASGILIVTGANFTATGGKGGIGTGGEGTTGGNGGAGVRNDGLLATNGSVTWAGGARGTAETAGQDGAAFAGNSDKRLSLNGNGASGAQSFGVRADGNRTITSVIDMLAAAPLNWPSWPGHTFGGWFETQGGEHPLVDGLRVDDVGVPFTYYAKWTLQAPPDPDPNSQPKPSPQPNPNPPAAPTSSAPATTSKSAAPSTTASATKPAATTTSKPSATTPSIPTNNLATPETFVSSSAPAPQPLPGVSQVDDSSASQFDVDTHNPTQGGDLTLTAKGFKPGTVVDFWMHSTPVYLGSAIADIHGIAVLPVKLTPALVGDHHVQSIGTGLLGEPRNLAQPITIDATPALASTGVATAPLTFLAVLLLAGGAALVLADRRRAGQAAHGARTGNRA